MAVSFTSEFPVMKVERNLVMSFTNMCVMMQFLEESDDEGNGEVLTTAQICAKAEELRVAIKRKLRKCNYDKCTVPVTSKKRRRAGQGTSEPIQVKKRRPAGLGTREPSQVEKRHPAGMGSNEPIQACNKKVVICVDSSSSDEAGASIAKKMHNGRSLEGTDVF